MKPIIKQRDGLIFQVSKGDIIKGYFLNIALEQHAFNIQNHLVNEKYNTKKEALNRLNQLFNKDISNDNFASCEKCLKVLPSVRFEGSQDGFYCDECLFNLNNGESLKDD